MSTVTLLSGSLRHAHDSFEATVVDVDVDLAHWQPGGTAHPIGSRYAHMVVTEDIGIQAGARGGAPMMATSWTGKTGIPDPEQALNTTLEWAQTVQIEVEALRAYAQAVYAASDEYLATLTDDDLEQTIDLSTWELGTMTLGHFLVNYVLTHVHDIMGEISATKGVKGLKGYPF